MPLPPVSCELGALQLPLTPSLLLLTPLVPLPPLGPPPSGTMLKGLAAGEDPPLLLLLASGLWIPLPPLSSFPWLPLPARPASWLRLRAEAGRVDHWACLLCKHARRSTPRARCQQAVEHPCSCLHPPAH